MRLMLQKELAFLERTATCRYQECDPQEYGACGYDCYGGSMSTALNILSTLDSSGVVVFVPDSLILAPVNLTGTEYLHLYPTSENCRKFDGKWPSCRWTDNQNIFVALAWTMGINAMFMQTYIGGVSCPYITSKRQDHVVLLVRCGSAPIRFNEKIIKNSWGEKRIGKFHNEP